jgi:hypothetical protein
MSQGGILGLAEVVKGLQVLSELRPLPNKERELYDNARHLLIAEITASLTITECDAEDAIDIALFPPGRERPKRTAAEFKPTGSEDDLELGGDLAALGVPDETSEDEEVEESEGAEVEEPAKKPKVELSDDEVTRTAVSLTPAVQVEEAPAPRRRGRPPKERPAIETLGPPPPPKKRGRPPKPKPLEPPGPPKKRGRPPKASTIAAQAGAVPETTQTKAPGKKK